MYDNAVVMVVSVKCAFRAQKLHLHVFDPLPISFCPLVHLFMLDYSKAVMYYIIYALHVAYRFVLDATFSLEFVRMSTSSSTTSSVKRAPTSSML